MLIYMSTYFGVRVPACTCFACVQLNDKQMYTPHVITKARSGFQAWLHMSSLQHGSMAVDLKQYSSHFVYERKRS